MSLLDRYLIKIFLSAFFISLATLLSLSIVIDFATNSALFFGLKDRSWITFMPRYYSARMPVFLLYTLPTATLVAAMFSLVRLARRNELLPIITAGRSLRRLAVPIFVLSLMVGGAMAMMEEFLLPGLAEKMGETRAILAGRVDEHSIIYYGEDGTLLEAGHYNKVEKRINGVRITQIAASGKRKFVLHAARGVWDDRRNGWVFSHGKALRFDPDGTPKMERNEEGEFVIRYDPLPALFQCEIKPRHLLRPMRLIGGFSRISDLRERTEQLPHVPSFRVRLYSRLSFPLSPLILVLIGLPFVSISARTGFVRGLLSCFLLVFLYYVIHFVLMELGSSGRIPAWLAAWGSTGGFALVGIFLSARMKT